MTPHRLPGTNGLSQNRFVLTPQQLRFVEEFLLSHDPDDAARRVGLTSQEGRRLLSHRKIQDAISFASRRALTRQQVYLEDVLRNLVALRDADPDEIVALRRKPCRHCWGDEHEYQFTDIEYRHALAEHRRAMQTLAEKDPDDPRLVPFDERGGAGYTANRDPCRGPDWVEVFALANPNTAPPIPTADHSCPNCHGDGELRVLIRDTRTLSYGARLLHNGIKRGANGQVEVAFRDRSWAEDRLLRYAGAFNDRRAPTDPNRLGDDRLVEAVAALVETGTLEYEALPAPDTAITDVEPEPVTEDDE